MAISLSLNGTDIPLTKGSYTEKRNYIDTKNVTESGATIREIVRTGIISLSISLICDHSLKKKLDGYADEASLTVIYWSEKAAALQTITGYIDDYSTDLIADVSSRFYDISFKVVQLS